MTPSEILAKIKPFLIESNKINPNDPMKQSQDRKGNIYIYKLPTNPVVFVFTSSGAIDCDGQSCPGCKTDPTHQGDTSFHQSDGKPLAPCILPWYVLPETPNPIFDYAKLNISGGQVGLVIYDDKMDFGVFGDERGRDAGNSDGKSIGEVSYAMAKSLSIDPDPDTGGVSTGVTYIVFTSKQNIVDPIEDHDKATTIGNSALDLMLNQLGGGPTPPPSTKFNIHKDKTKITVSASKTGTLTADQACQQTCDFLKSFP